MSGNIHQELVFKASPKRVYQALMNGKEHAGFTGAPATIDGKAGGEFSVYGGGVVGRNIELVPDERIVQAWRAADWPAGVYTLVKIELKAYGKNTKLTLDHTGLPEGAKEHLEGGWRAMYWDKLTALFG